MSGFLELFSQYDVLGAFLVNIELTLWCSWCWVPTRS